MRFKEGFNMIGDDCSRLIIDSVYQIQLSERINRINHDIQIIGRFRKDHVNYTYVNAFINEENNHIHYCNTLIVSSLLKTDFVIREYYGGYIIDFYEP